MSNKHTHVYTCLATPPELEQFGLTHMVCRVETPDRPVAAFNSSAAASSMCEQLNEFCKQDKPELNVDVAEQELAKANELAAESERAEEALKKIKEAQEHNAIELGMIRDEKFPSAAPRDPKVIELSLSDKIAAVQKAAAEKK